MLGQLRQSNAPPPSSTGPGPAVAAQSTPDDGQVHRGSPELRAAADHIVQLCSSAGLKDPAKAELSAQIASALALRYREHWHPAQALRGSGFRCLVFPAGGVDPALTNAFAACDMDPIVLRSAMPSPELAINIWCDPGTVASRIGCGCVHTVYTASPPATAAAPKPSAHKPSTISAAIAITSPPDRQGRSVSPQLSPKANSFRPRSNSPPQAPPKANAKAAAFRVPQVGAMAMSPPPGLARTPPGLPRMPAFTFAGLVPMRV